MFRGFDYVRPTDISGAIDALSTHEDSEILAGGTDLLLRLRETSGPDKLLVDIKRCEGLRGIEERQAGLFIGPLTTIRELVESALIRERYRCLWDAASVFGCHEIRNRATIGGNIVHASPGAESGTPLFVFEASVELTGPSGKRTLPVLEFWQGAGKVQMQRGEVLTGILLPEFSGPIESRYRRISRTKGMDLAALGVSVLVTSPDNPSQREIRIAMAAVEQVPYRNREVESLLSHRVLDGRIIAEAKVMMAESIHPRDTSIRANPSYKRAMVGNLTEQILGELELIEEGAAEK